LAIGLCLLNFIVPMICGLLAKIENFNNKSTESIVKIIRILVIQNTAIFLVFYSSIRSFKTNPYEKVDFFLILSNKIFSSFYLLISF
jgi:hypothetical protein